MQSISSGERAEELTREFVHAYWDADMDQVATMLDSDFVWIGAQEDEYAMARDEAVDEFRAVAHNFKRVILSEEDYHCVLSSGDLHIVVGQYLGYTDPQLEMIFAARQRLTLIWREHPDGTMLLAHYHVSNPLDAVEPGEKFPKRYAQQTFRYINSLMRQRGEECTRSIRDARGVLRLVQPFDVEYLEARRKSTIVHCSNSEFRVNMGITQLTEKLSGDTLHCFVRVQRGYAVNALFVVNTRGGTVTLVSGASLPVSPGRVREVRDEIERARLV